MPSVQGKIFINASPTQVWTVLTAFSTYPLWSETTPSIICSLKPNGPVKFQMQLDTAKKPITTNAYVITVDEGKELTWGVEPLYFDVLGKVRHSFTMEEAKDVDGKEGTMFVNRETFEGAIAGVLTKDFLASVERGHNGFCRQIRERVELLEDSSRDVVEAGKDGS